MMRVKVEKFTIEIDSNLIKTLKKALIKNGDDVPKNKREWSRTINTLLREKIIDDFGEEMFE